MKTRSGSLWVTVATPAEMPAVFALRHDVFVVGQNVPVEIERDEFDDVAVHVCAWESDPEASVGVPPRLAGTGRLLGEPPAPGRVGRMAVRAELRGSGVGRAVLRGLERAAIRRGNPAIELHAQVHAREFYAKAGYTPVGSEFEEAGIRHVEMRKELPVIRPVADSDSEALIELIGTTWAEYPGCVLDVDGEEPWLRAPATYYATHGGRLWVAELGGTVVGSVGIRPGPDPDTAELKSLYVSASARRHGLGEVLTSLVEDEAVRLGVRQLELWSDTRFLDAHRFYARLGYEQLPGSRELHDLSETVEYPFAKSFPYAEYAADLVG
ncbi:GNAT family N-acetyltransferase [Cryptosporangium phraense]|uniref:GNAT family N-acetyltransferase n=1 Tax=Cryptosporangium phraense TaxID=2593070 RepID=A0A545AKF5_9ACTN|nr:GNAT family N-acetyltransferase [Cryptosporangium phraense]TQS41751.1 GNAT family N-acetyltransferase [Cryptosporangium phraense]